MIVYRKNFVAGFNPSPHWGSILTSFERPAAVKLVTGVAELKYAIGANGMNPGNCCPYGQAVARLMDRKRAFPAVSNHSITGQPDALAISSGRHITDGGRELIACASTKSHLGSPL